MTFAKSPRNRKRSVDKPAKKPKSSGVEPNAKPAAPAPDDVSTRAAAFARGEPVRLSPDATMQMVGGEPPSRSECEIFAKGAALACGEAVSLANGESLQLPDGSSITNSGCESVRLSAGATASEKLEQAFSLTTCKRLLALVEEHNRDASRLHELRERLKACKKELEGGVDDARRSELCIAKYEDEVEAKACKDSMKVSCFTVLALILEAGGGGTLFEAAEASKPAPGESPVLESDSPAALYPRGATVLTHTGEEVAAVFPEDGTVDAGMTSTWWAWWRAGVPAWADQQDWKVGAMITLLDSVDCQTPARYLRNVYRWFREAADRKAAIESLPDLSAWRGDGVHSILVRLCRSANRGDLGADLEQIASANVDAFIDFVRGPDGDLNRLRIEFESK